MTHKILHIIAALFTAVAAALVLPHFCKGGRSSFSHLYTDAIYSEILQDFIFSRYESVYEEGRMVSYTVYRDSQGNRIDRSAVDSLSPLNNATQLAFENRFPDTICGVAVTARQAEEAVFRHRISMPALDYGLYDLVDSHSYLSQKFNTQDLLRFTATGLEFLLPESNSIDTAKTRIFDRALAESGFEAPMTRIWSPSNRTDIEQLGFFLNDRNGRLFRLSMTEGAPVVEPLARPDDKEVLLMSFGDEEDFLAIVVTTDGSSYLMPRDSVSYQRLPLPSFTGKSVSLSGNLRMKRDDVIQLSLVGFGIIEGGRIEFTRDSVLLLDRIHRCYVRMAYRDVGFLRDSGADFYTLQALFRNELVLPGVRHVTAGEASRFRVSRRPDGRVVLSGDEGGALACRFVTSLAGALLEQTEISTASGKALVWTYGDFVRMGTGHYPGRMEIVLRGQDMPVTAVIALSRIGTGDGWVTRTPVSARYRRMDARSLIRELMQM